MRWPATWLTSPKAYLWILLLSAALCLPSAFTGWMNDDYLHNLLITGRSTVPPTHDLSIYGQFSFVSGGVDRLSRIIDLGAFPWWTDTNTKVAFFRPLSELTHGLDYTLWPNSPLMMHVQNIVWYLLMLWVAYRCYVGLLGKSTLAAGLALFLYALDGSNGITMGWIANRNAVLATLAALASFQFFLSQRQQNKVFDWRGPAMFAVALLCAEYGISLLALVFSYAVCLDKAPLKERALSLTPYAAVLVAWAMFYSSQGFGTHDSGMYLDPLRQTGEYLRALPSRLLLLVNAQLNVIPIVVQPHTEAVTRVHVEFVVLMSLLLTPTLMRSRQARFFLLAALLSLLPVAAAYPEDRVLMFSGFGFMGLLSEFFVTWFDKSKRPALPKFVNFFYGFFTWILVIIHAVISPLSFIPTYQTPVRSVQHLVEKPALSLPYDDSIKDKTAIFINPPLALLGCYFSAVRLVNNLPVAAHTYFLTSAQGEVNYERVGPNSLRVTPEGGFLQNDYDYYPRSPSNLFKVGDKLHLTAMEVEITQVGPHGEPMQAIFTFDKPLEDPSLVWLAWTIEEFNPNNGHYELTKPMQFLAK